MKKGIEVKGRLLVELGSAIILLFIISYSYRENLEQLSVHIFVSTIVFIFLLFQLSEQSFIEQFFDIN